MKVYRFLEADYGLAALRERRLKISNLLEVNDLFDLVGADLSDKAFRSAVFRTREQMARSRGFICFSGNWRNPLLWSHYTKKHQGLSLGFEIPKSALLKVHYEPKRMKFQLPPTEPQMRLLLSFKYHHWKYEDEYRSFCTIEENGPSIQYVDFSESMRLFRVIVGASSRITRSDLYTALGDLEGKIDVFKARPAFREFKVVRNRNEKLWV